MTPVADRPIVLGVCGGVAAYKAAVLASSLTKAGARVQTILTRSATEFIAPLTFQSLTRQPVYVDVFDERDPGRIAHIALADAADLIVVAPATADAIGRIAHGLGDDMLAATLLAATCPVVLAPAMNVHMYENPIVRRNLDSLAELGYWVAEPGTGPLACGYTGKGRLMEPEDIFEFICMALTPKLLSGRSVVVTAGPTRERIDPVRHLANDSTGTMGYELARMAWRMGARVTLISGPVALAPPLGVDLVAVVSAADMLEAVARHAAGADALVMAAAVGDFRPRAAAAQKIKKADGEDMMLALTPNPDILKTVARSSARPRFVLGFAAETQDAQARAREKLAAKGLDMIACNNVLEEGAGFGAGTNRVTLFGRDGSEEALPLMPKREVAEAMLVRLAARL